jgi:hypothetical protein
VLAVSLAIHLPPREDQQGFNLRVWQRMLEDPQLAKIEGRLETDLHGHIVMSPPPSRQHGSRQFAIARLFCARSFRQCLKIELSLKMRAAALLRGSF